LARSLKGKIGGRDKWEVWINGKVWINGNDNGEKEIFYQPINPWRLN
jgi:hypothetical protein